MPDNSMSAPRRWLSQHNKQAFRNPWVLGWIAMVLAVFAINAYMVTQAYLTSPGLVNDQYYDKGKNYNETLVKRRAVAALGWKVKVDRPGKPLLGQPAHYQIRAVDAQGNPIQADEVRLYAYRPADETADFQVQLLPEAPGHYSAEVAYPLKGMWDIVIHVRQGDYDYEIAQRTRVWAQ